VTGRRLAGAQTTFPARSVPVGSFVYDGISGMWVEVTAVATDDRCTVIRVIAEHDVPLQYDAGEPVAVCEAFTLTAAWRRPGAV
jgi:hypothetical protein